MKNIGFLAFGFLFSLMCFVPQSSAKIFLEPLEGSLLITSPDGNVKLLDFGEAVPEVQTNSTIEVFQGQMKITVTDQDSATWGCGGNSGSVGGGSSVTISCGDTSGLLEVLEGEISFTDNNGAARTAKAGEKVDLKVIPKAAPPAADDGRETGDNPENENDEPDSRSIEASVSQ